MKGKRKSEDIVTAYAEDGVLLASDRLQQFVQATKRQRKGSGSSGSPAVSLLSCDHSASPTATPTRSHSFRQHSVMHERSCDTEEGYIFHAPPQYTEFEYLAKGSFGVVCTAQRGEEEVAVKRIHCRNVVDAESALRELHNLAFFACAGSHGVCPILDCWMHQATSDTTQAFLYMVLRKYDTSLDAFVERRKTLRVADWRRVGYMLAKSLQDLHWRGGLHRDLKPENVVVSADMKDLALIDLGSVRAADKEQQVRPMTPISQVATEGYRGPEVVDDETCYTQPFDIFAAGCLLAELRMHQSLFDTHEDTVAFKKMSKKKADEFLRSSLKMCAKRDVELLLSMLARDPADRPTPEEVLEAFAKDVKGGDEVDLDDEQKGTYAEPSYDPQSLPDMLRVIHEIVAAFHAVMSAKVAS
eukprot:TRINITY_DN1703_c0_g2_i1.p1 TRINITY_DN1703_c0_g2~~TRINITY_DN1703_c0_g2_i1.p1  ORF type:complete len:429 (+),score=154.02 TRINITY_DN1703_c0_g2_i1:46-1287(+)